MAIGSDLLDIDGNFVRVEGVRGLDCDGESSLEALQERQSVVGGKTTLGVIRIAARGLNK